MSPKEAKVFLAEDDLLIADDLKEKLEAAGHQVVLTARTRTEALAMISQFKDKGIQVAILGGSLDTFRRPDHPDNDSQVILRALHDADLNHIPTIGFSGNYVPGVTIDIGKGRGPRQIVEAVTQLPASTEPVA